MPGGKRNPFNMSSMLGQLGDVVSNAKGRKADMVHKLSDLGLQIPYVDVKITVGSIAALFQRFLISAVYCCC